MLPEIADTQRGDGRKIVLVIAGLGSGGAERIICGLANHWAANGWSVTLVSFGPPEKPYYLVGSQVRILQIDIAAGPNPLRQSMLRIRAFRKIIKDVGPIIVVSFLTKINVIALLATIGLGVRTIISERNNADLQYVHPCWRYLRSITYLGAFCFVAPTRGVLESFAWPIRARGSVIPNAVDVSFCELDAAPRSDRTIVAVGRLVHQKGFDLLLQAFAQVAPVRPDWSLVIWGEGEERPSLLRLRDALGLTGRVRMPGVTASPGEWARAGEVFVLSSRFEGFANVVAEAMAAGMPVLAFDCDWGPGELIEHETDGLLVKAGDVAALAEGLLRLTGDPELRRTLGHAARRSVRRIRSEIVMARWDALLQEAAREQGAGDAQVSR